MAGHQLSTKTLHLIFSASPAETFREVLADAVHHQHLTFYHRLAFLLQPHSCHISKIDRMQHAACSPQDSPSAWRGGEPVVHAQWPPGARPPAPRHAQSSRACSAGQPAANVLHPLTLQIWRTAATAFAAKRRLAGPAQAQRPDAATPLLFPAARYSTGRWLRH